MRQSMKTKKKDEQKEDITDENLTKAVPEGEDDSTFQEVEKKVMSRPW
jgi:hypothetical protein